jgi:hypothetical protein
VQRAAAIDAWRGIALILACLALGLRLVAPAGFMPAADGGGLVICTGGLPLEASQKPQDPAKPPADSERGCVFASPAAAPPVEAPVIARAAWAEYVAAEFSFARDLAPGRGLAAPPPPAIGPPTVLA